MHSRAMFRKLTIALCVYVTGAALVYGPGLSPDKIVMPARYFFVDLSSEGDNGSSLGQFLRVEIGGVTSEGGACRLWINKLDRRDSTFIIRYKLYETCYNFYIKLYYKDKHIAGSPYKFEEPVQADQCNCPELNLKEWLSEYGCPHNYSRIHEDLKPFPLSTCLRCHLSSDRGSTDHRA